MQAGAIKSFASRLYQLYRPSPQLQQARTNEEALCLLAQSGLFDLEFYCLQLDEPEMAWSEAALHYLTVGYKNHLDPHPLFDTGFYLQCNDDVARVGINPLLHFLRSGWREQRDPHPLFNMRFYVKQNRDIFQEDVNPLVHFVANGAQEGREFSRYFDSKYYGNLWRIRRGSQPNGTANLMLHFLTFGAGEGVFPCPDFETFFAIQAKQFRADKANRTFWKIIPQDLDKHSSGTSDVKTLVSLAVQYAIEDDRQFDAIVETSCNTFHHFYKWDGYPRTLADDVEQVKTLAARGDAIRLDAKVRSFLMLCSDPAVISFEQSAEPVIALGLKDFDIASVSQRGLKGRFIFFLVFFGGYLKRSGDFDSAERFYNILINHGFEAEGLCGLADVYHLLACWQAETNEYKEKQIVPDKIEVPNGFANDRIVQLGRYDYEKAIGLYRQAVQCAPEVSFYKIHYGRALLSAGKVSEALDAFAAAKETKSPNRFAHIYWRLCQCLMAPGLPARLRGDFFAAQTLNTRFADIRAVRLADSSTVAAIGGETIALTEDERVLVTYHAVTNGQSVSKSAEILYPGTEAVRLSIMRDLGFGLKLAYENLLLVDSRGLALSELKLFNPSVMMVGIDRAVIGLPEHPEHIRSQKTLFTLPGVSFNYYHWLFESLGAALLLAESAGLDDFELTMRAPLTNWQEESMVAALSKLPDIRLTPHPTDRFIFEDALHLPYPAQMNMPNPQAVRLLREHVSRHKSAPEPGKRIFLSRPKLHGRKTVNESDIESYLVKMGFAAVDTSEMNFSQQVDLFSDVEVIVAPAGAALANLVFCPEQTKVIILSCAFHYQETYTALASILGQRCWVCKAGCITRPNPYFIWSVFDQTHELQNVLVAVEEALDLQSTM